MQVQVSAKHCLVGVPNIPAVKNLFPSADTLNVNGIEHLLIPHQPVETYMLRKLGFEVPAPILTQYDWPHPIGQPPFNAQKQTAALMTTENRCYILNGLGTGKTRSALWAFDYLRGKSLAKRALVVGPLSTLRFTWTKEIFNVLPENLRSVVLYGSKQKRLELLKKDVDVYIINHDGVRTILDELYKRDDIDVLILDELAVYRNGGSQRTKDMKKFAHTRKWVWGMTGSPIPNSPTDAWAEAMIVTPNRVPRYFSHYRDDLMVKVNQFKYVPKPNAVDKAYQTLQPAVRFTLDDVYELPDKVTRYVDVEMGANQKKVYKELADSCYAAVQNHEITAANAGAVMSKLLQVATGWVYTSTRDTVELDNLNRLDALLDAIRDTDRKVLVFSPFKHALEGIAKVLKKEGIDQVIVSGDTSSTERNKIFNLFQNTGKYKVLNAHPQCLAHGVTLTAADTIIWFAPVTSLEIYEQANARISRVGQKHKQLVLHLQSTKVERHIYNLLRDKQKVQEKLLDLFEAATQG
jgi:SNF2 family DNA or RNA helicase